MEQFQTINVTDAEHLLEHEKAVIADIRDAMTFAQGHPLKAFHLTQETWVDFIDSTSRETPVIVICYHGHSSQGAAQYLISQGFDKVYSLHGGFEAWRQHGTIEGGY